MYVDITKLETRKNPETIKPINTIPSITLCRFGVTREGYVLDKSTQKYVDTYYDYGNQSIVTLLPVKKSAFDISSYEWFSVPVLMLKAFYGEVNVGFRYTNGSGWKNPEARLLKYNIKDVRTSTSDFSILIINGVEFKRTKYYGLYVSQTGVIYDTYTHKYVKRREVNDKVRGEYLLLPLEDSSKMLHRVVYETWRGPIPEGYEVNHINHYRWDCNLCNLDLLSKRDNLREASEFNGKSYIKNDEEAVNIYNDLKERKPTAELAEKYNLSQGTIQAIKSGRRYDDVISANTDKIYLHKDSPTGITPEDVKKICEMIIAGRKESDIAREMNVGYNSITAIKSGRIFKPIAQPYLNRMQASVTDMGKSLNTQQVHEICKLIEEGKGPTEIGKMYGVCEGTIMKIKDGRIWGTVSKDYDFSKWSEKKSGTKLNGEKVHEICKVLLENKYNTDEIGEMFGVSRTTVNDILCGRTWNQIGCQYDFSNVVRRPQRGVRKVDTVSSQGSNNLEST